MKFHLTLKILLTLLLFCWQPVCAYAQTSPPSEPLESQTYRSGQDNKNPWIAAGMSLALPGSGQMYVNEQIWPEILITAGIAAAVLVFFVVDQQRAASIQPRSIGSQTQNLADAHWDAMTLILQIAVPSLWLWNAGDAYRQAELQSEKVMPELNSGSNAYIIKENLVSVTLWQF